MASTSMTSKKNKKEQIGFSSEETDSLINLLGRGRPSSTAATKNTLIISPKTSEIAYDFLELHGLSCMRVNLPNSSCKRIACDSCKQKLCSVNRP